MEVGFSQKPSVSLFLSCASAVTHIIAEAAYLLFTVLKSVESGLPRGFWCQCRPQTGLLVAVGQQTQTRPSIEAEIMDIDMIQVAV